MVPHAHATNGLNELKHVMAEVAIQIREEGLPASLLPFICGFTGYGNVSNGAQEILDILPVTEIPPEGIFKVFENPSPTKVYKVVFKEKDMVEPRQPGSLFDLQDYYDRPEKYRSQFDVYLPCLTVLMNCIFWNPRYPRVVTRNSIRALSHSSGEQRLRVIGDISCDLEGSIEFNKKITDPDSPIYVYNAVDDIISDGYKGDGVVVMSIDNLPCELPRESSTEFSHVLKRFIPGFLSSDFSQEFFQCGLPLPLKKAVILYHGDLTSNYQYLSKYLSEKK
jgi:alpha-aminoadipic semialdehyde synthase